MPTLKCSTAVVRRILVASFLVLLVSLIGVAAPSPSVQFRRSATGCPYGIEKFNTLECAGVNFVAGVAWQQTVSPIDGFVRTFDLAARAVCVGAMWTTPAQLSQSAMTLKLLIQGAREEAGVATKWTVLHDESQVILEACDERSVTLWRSESAVYSEYTFTVTASPVNGSLSSWLADVRFEFSLGDATSSLVQLALQTVFFVMACGCFVWWSLYVSSAPARLWTQHHLWTTVLVSVALVYFQPILFAWHLLAGQTFLSSSIALLKALFYAFSLFYGVLTLADYSSTRLSLVVKALLVVFCLVFFITEFVLIVLRESIATYTSSENVELFLVSLVIIYAIAILLWSIRILITWNSKQRTPENWREFVSVMCASGMLGVGLGVVKLMNAYDVNHKLALPFTLELGLVFAYIICVATPADESFTTNTDLLISVDSPERDVLQEDEAGGVELTRIDNKNTLAEH